MGETEKANQGTPLGTGQSSGSQEGSTSEQTPKTFTKEGHEKILSDKLTIAGRDAKALETREASLKAKEEAVAQSVAKIEQWQTERDEELKSTNPDQYDIAVEKRKTANERAKLDADIVTHAERLKAADETEREITIWRIAEKIGVDAEKLKANSTEFNLQDEDQIEKMAQTMAGAKGGETPLLPDSGVTIGGVGWKDLSPDDKIRQGLNK